MLGGVLLIWCFHVSWVWCFFRVQRSVNILARLCSFRPLSLLALCLLCLAVVSTVRSLQDEVRGGHNADHLAMWPEGRAVAGTAPRGAERGRHRGRRVHRGVGDLPPGDCVYRRRLRRFVLRILLRGEFLIYRLFSLLRGGFRNVLPALGGFWQRCKPSDIVVDLVNLVVVVPRLGRVPGPGEDGLDGRVPDPRPVGWSGDHQLLLRPGQVPANTDIVNQYPVIRVGDSEDSHGCTATNTTGPTLTRINWRT